MIVTIICACGQHNAVPDEELERAICNGCHSPLLRPVFRSVAAVQTVPLTTPTRPLLVTP